jgi:tetratricopeptide (TPR) repeat protein
MYRVQIAAVVVGLTTVWSASASASPTCNPNTKGPSEVVIENCTRVLNDPKASIEAKAHAFRRRGAEKSSSGAYDEAVADLTAGLALGPQVSRNTRSNILRLRSEAQWLLKDTRSTWRDAYAALEMDPREPQAYLHLSLLYRFGNIHKSRLAMLDEVLRLAPDLTVARLERAQARWELQLFDGVLEDTKIAMTKGKRGLQELNLWDRAYRDVDGWTLAVALRSRALTSVMRIPEGDALVKTLVREHPSAASFRTRGEFYNYLPQYPGGQSRDSEALSDFMAAVRLDPDDDMSWWHISRLLTSAGRLDEALTAISIAIDRQPSRQRTDSTYQWDKARILRRAGRIEEAVDTILKAWSGYIADGKPGMGWYFIDALKESGYIPEADVDIAPPTERQFQAAVAGCMRDPRC